MLDKEAAKEATFVVAFMLGFVGIIVATVMLLVWMFLYVSGWIALPVIGVLFIIVVWCGAYYEARH